MTDVDAPPAEDQAGEGMAAPPKPRSKASFYLAKKKEENESEDRAAAAKNFLFTEQSKGTNRKKALKSVGKGVVKVR